MRYLKLYEEYDTIPANFIKLMSIGHVLDPEEGVIYAMWKKGGYDHENPYDVGYDESIDGISDEDMELVNVYWLTCKPFIESKMNWELIQTAKDASLDYLDEGFKLNINVFVLGKSEVHFANDKLLVYSELFSHDKNDYPGEYFRDFFPNKMEMVKSGDLYYRFSLEPSRDSRQWGTIVFHPEKSNELRSLLKEMFPEETIISR